jgi:hypothetical protein
VRRTRRCSRPRPPQRFVTLSQHGPRLLSFMFGHQRGMALEPGPPRKFWDFNTLLGKLAVVIKRLVDTTPPTRKWETIWFALRNGATITHTISAVGPSGQLEGLRTSPEIEELVTELLTLLNQPPCESWTGLNVELWGKPRLDNKVVSWGQRRPLG